MELFGVGMLLLIGVTLVLSGIGRALTARDLTDDRSRANNFLFAGVLFGAGLVVLWGSVHWFVVNYDLVRVP